MKFQIKGKVITPLILITGCIGMLILFYCSINSGLTIGSSAVKKNSIDLSNKSTKVSNSAYNPNKAFRTTTSKFADLSLQKIHEDNYPQKVIFQNDEKAFKQRVTGYWGIAQQQRFDGVQIMRDSNFNDFTIAFANTLATEKNNSRNNLGANYWDQIQEIHAFGGAVTMSFGGAGGDTSFFNNAPSSYVMFTKLLSVCISYHIFSFDFDLEGSHSLDTDELKALAHALAHVKTVVKEMYNRDLQVRFTTSYIMLDVDTFCDIYDKTGSNVIWNDMSMTSVSKSINSNLPSNPINTVVQSIYNHLKTTETYKKHNKNFILHHIGVTANINRTYDWGKGQYADVCTSYFKNYKTEAQQLGLYGIWSISTDHRKSPNKDPNQQLDPEHQGGGQTNDKYDFQVTHVLEHLVNANYTNNQSPTPKLATPQNLERYSENQQYITLKWSPVDKAKFYRLTVSDPAGKNNAQIAEVSRTMASFSLRRAYDNDDEKNSKPSVIIANLLKNPELKMSVTAVGADKYGKEVTSSPVTITVKNPKLSLDLLGKSLFGYGQTEYYDQNIDYKNFGSKNKNNVYVTATPYIYYNGDIYEYILKSSMIAELDSNQKNSAGVKSKVLKQPNSKEWKKLTTLDLSAFGLSKDRLTDLAKFQWVQAPKPIQTFKYKIDDDTSKSTDENGKPPYFLMPKSVLTPTKLIPTPLNPLIPIKSLKVWIIVVPIICVVTVALLLLLIFIKLRFSSEQRLKNITMITRRLPFSKNLSTRNNKVKKKD